MKHTPSIALAAIVIGAGLWFGASVPATAADDPANVIKYRQMVMKSIGAHMGQIGMIAKGEVSYGLDQVEDNAASIALMATLVPGAFKANVGNTAAETIAKANIWTDWAGFEAKAEDLGIAATRLAQAAGSGDSAAVGAAVGALGGACGACHKAYRVKKE